MFTCSLGTALALGSSGFRLLSKYRFFEEIFCAQDLQHLEVSTNMQFKARYLATLTNKWYVGEEGEKCFGPCSPLVPGACPAGVPDSRPPGSGHCSGEKG